MIFVKIKTSLHIFNINLLNNKTHQNTQNFTNVMVSMGIYPLITKPTRITEYSLTLIDNIFINNVKGINKSGIFMSDSSDRLFVFVCSHYELLYKLHYSHVYKRSLNGENIMLFNQSLQTTDSTEVFQCSDVNNNI